MEGDSEAGRGGLEAFLRGRSVLQRLPAARGSPQCAQIQQRTLERRVKFSPVAYGTRQRPELSQGVALRMLPS